MDILSLENRLGVHRQRSEYQKALHTKGQGNSMSRSMTKIHRKCCKVMEATIENEIKNRLLRLSSNGLLG